MLNFSNKTWCCAIEEDIHDFKNYNPFENDIFTNLVRNKNRRYGHTAIYIPSDKKGYVHLIELTHSSFQNCLVPINVALKRGNYSYRAHVVLNDVDVKRVFKRANKLYKANVRSCDWNYYNSLVHGRDLSRETKHKYHTCTTVIAYMLGIKKYEYYDTDKLVTELVKQGHTLIAGHRDSHSKKK